MRDTIYRDDAIRVASGYCHPANVAKELAKLPSAQPEIVRCKDCKWCYMGECEHKLGLIVANDENYCSYAERRSEDGGSAECVITN